MRGHMLRYEAGRLSMDILCVANTLHQLHCPALRPLPQPTLAARFCFRSDPNTQFAKAASFQCSCASSSRLGPSYVASPLACLISSAVMSNTYACKGGRGRHARSSTVEQAQSKHRLGAALSAVARQSAVARAVSRIVPISEFVAECVALLWKPSPSPWWGASHPVCQVRMPSPRRWQRTRPAAAAAPQRAHAGSAPGCWGASAGCGVGQETGIRGRSSDAGPQEFCCVSSAAKQHLAHKRRKKQLCGALQVCGSSPPDVVQARLHLAHVDARECVTSIQPVPTALRSTARTAGENGGR